MMSSTVMSSTTTPSAYRATDDGTAEERKTCQPAEETERTGYATSTMRPHAVLDEVAANSAWGCVTLMSRYALEVWSGPGEVGWATGTGHRGS